MPATDLANCVGSYIMDSGGWNPLYSRLNDQSGLGRHAPLASGSVTLTSRGGVSCIDFTSQYFELPCPITPHGSFVIAINSNTTGVGDGTLWPLAFRQTKFPAGDHAAETPRTPWEDFDLSQNVNIYGSRFRITDSAADPLVDATMTLNAWNILTGVYSRKTMQAKVQLNAGTPVIDSPATAELRCQWLADTMRIGYINATGTIASGGHIAIGEVHFFSDDVLLDQPTAHSAFLSELMTKYGIS